MPDLVNKINSVQKGKNSELKAAEFLKAKDYSILECNFVWRRRTGKQGGEIDLVCVDCKKRELVFVEVRSSKKKSTFLKSSIGSHKQTRLIHSAKTYLNARKQFNGWPYRFDIVWIEENQIEHWQNTILR